MDKWKDRFIALAALVVFAVMSFFICWSYVNTHECATEGSTNCTWHPEKHGNAKGNQYTAINLPGIGVAYIYNGE